VLVEMYVPATKETAPPLLVLMLSEVIVLAEMYVPAISETAPPVLLVLLEDLLHR